MVPERLVRFPVRTILTVLGTIIAVAVVLEVIMIARHVIVWILISLFLALAMNPVYALIVAGPMSTPRRSPIAGSPMART